MKLYKYRAFSLNIESEFELPGLEPGGEGIDVHIRAGSVNPERWRTTLASEIAFTPSIGRFWVQHGTDISVDVAPGADPDLFRSILLGRVMAFLLRQRGWLPLHASGIALATGGVLFVGPSGAGKSTTAAAFHRNGHVVVTDDIGPVRAAGGVCELGTVTSRVKLLDDSLEVLADLKLPARVEFDKQCFELNRGTLPAVVPLRAIYLLAVGGSLRIERLSKLESVSALSEHTLFSRYRSEASVIASHLERCARIADLVPVRRLTRSRSFGALNSLVRLVEAEIETLKDTPTPATGL